MSLSANASLSIVRATLHSFKMLPGKAPILAAVSGGPDSVALAHILADLRIPFHIAHFDHQTRGGASAEDAAFVKNLAAELAVPLYSTGRDIAAEAADSPMSFEEYAREARYAFLVETAKANACAAIATGHHADDQAETVLMRMIRGTSPRGLAGIPPKGLREGVPIVRPLFRLTRDDVLAYLRERGHSHCHDESNLDLGFVRNRIRHELIPQIRHEYNPRVREALGRLSDAQRAENDLLASMTTEFMERCVSTEGAIQRKEFREGHRALQRRAVIELAWRYGAEPDFQRDDQAVDFIIGAPSGKRFDLGSGVQLVSAKDFVEIAQSAPVPVDRSEVPVTVPGETSAFGKRIVVRPLEAPPVESLSSYCTPSRQVVDAVSLAGEVCLRHRRNGDRIAPLGLGGTRKLKDYFCDLGIPAAQRDRKLLLVADGEIVWIVGHAVSAKAAVTDRTTAWMEIESLDEAE